MAPYKTTFALSIIGLATTAIMSLAFPWFLAKLVGGVVDLPSGPVPQSAPRLDWLPDGDPDRVLLILLVILAVQAIIVYWRVKWLGKSVEYAMRDLRDDVFRHVLSLPVAQFQKFRTGELGGRLTGDLGVLRTTVMETLPQTIRAAITLLGGGAVILLTSAKLSVFSLGILPLVIIAVAVFGRKIRKLSRKVQDELSEANVAVEEAVQSVNDVKGFANEEWEMARHRTAVDKYAEAGITSAAARGMFIGLIVFGMMGTVAVIVWYGAGLLASGEISGEEFARFLLFSVFVGASFGGLPEIMGQISRGMGATERLREILDIQPEVSLERATTPNSEPREKRLRPEPVGGSLHPALEMDAISFSYPGRPETQILDTLSFQVQPGERVALVGPSGSGKSTILQLFQGFYGHAEGLSQGTIKVFGKSPAEWSDLRAMRRQMAAVPQEILLFGGSIRDNIRYGNAQASEEEIELAAEQANAAEFIRQFPEGFDTQVGPRGVQLSGGQRQRIAIARAILANPRILLLDEATSSLDSASESLVNQAIERLMQGRTVLVVAHRLATVRNCDRILVLNQGKLAEAGTHEQLMANPDGIYQALVKAQML